MSGRTRIGTVGYLNAAPLTDLLDRERYEVVSDHPRGIAAALAEGHVDVALAPVAAVLTDGDFRIVPGVAIGADGPVHSVVIVAETPPSEWTEVVLDQTSRTSITLARLLLTRGPLADEVDEDLEIREVEPGQGPVLVGGTTAAVVIGDPARELPEGLKRWDLAELWRTWTGKPFVFAVWAGRPDLDAEVIADLRAAGEQGVATVAERHEGEDLRYLTENLRYALDERALMGLRWYASMAHRDGLIGTEHVQLYGPPRTFHDRPRDLDTLLADAAAGVRLRVDQAISLHEGVPGAETAVAAHARRTALHGAERATYLVERRIDAKSKKALEAELDTLGEEIAGVHLVGLGALDWGDLYVRIDKTDDRDLKSLGLDLEQLKKAALQRGSAPVELLSDLAHIGLGALTWRVGPSLPDAYLLHAAADEGVPIHVALTITADMPSEELFAQLGRVRRLQDETRAIHAVALDLPLPEGALVQPGHPTTAAWLRAVSMARLFLDSVPHITASPLSQGLDASQTALFVGADDLGAVGEGPLEVPWEGAAFAVGVEEAERALRVAGLEPERRDAAFASLGGPLTKMRKVRRVEERAQL